MTHNMQGNQANFVALTPLSFLERTVGIFPHYPSISYNDTHYTWHDTHQRVHAMARALVYDGLQKGDVVSVILPNIPEMIELHYAINLAGGVINTINTRLDNETIAYILQHSDAKYCIIDSGFTSVTRYVEHDDNLQHITYIMVDDAYIDANDKYTIGTVYYHDLITQGMSRSVSLPTIDDEWQTSALNYTSGTSARPKGVLYHHRGAYLMALGTVSGWGLTMHPIYLYLVPMFHCNGWGHVYSMTLQAGHFICTRTINTADICRDITRYNVTHFGAAPVILSMLVHDDATQSMLPLHTINVMTAGAPPAPAIIEKCEKLNLNVTQVYGLTETFGHVIESLWQREWNALPDATRAEYKARQGVAFPITDDVRVVDVDTKRDVPRDGEHMGEILIKGNTVMKGYFKDEVATNKAFDGGYFHSGDLAVMHDNGYIEVKDRLKDIIISGGENISSVEIEAVLYKLPGVQAVAVIAMPHDKWGEVPKAFIEMSEGAALLTNDDVIAHCRQYLAGFKVPKMVEFMALPKTATGKIQKFKLKTL